MFIKTKMRFKSQTFPIETICGPLAICSTRCRMGSSNSNKRSAALDLCILPILAFPPGNTRRPHGAHINGNIFVYLYLCICVFVFVYLYLCICICVFVFVYLYLCICIFVFVYLYLCICICVFVFVFVYLCIWSWSCYSGGEACMWGEWVNSVNIVQ